MYRDTLGQGVGEEEFFDELLVGRHVAAYYEGDLWHQRVLLWREKGSRSRWVILTPDNDLYVEDMKCDRRNGIARCHLLSSSSHHPRPLWGRSYRFRAQPSEAEMRALVRRARADLGALAAPPEDIAGAMLADGSQVDLSVLADVPAAAPAAVAGPPWRVVDFTDGLRYGSEVEPALVKVQLGDVGLAVIKGKTVKVARIEAEDVERGLATCKSHADLKIEAEQDIRTLAVEFDTQGRRHKSWKGVCDEIYAEGMESAPLEGPCSVVSLCRYFEVHGGNPRDWLSVWCREKGLDGSERVCHELRTLADIIYLTGTFDQLNLASLAGIELAGRRLQLLCDAYQNPSKPNWESARLFVGLPDVSDVVTKEMRQHVSSRAQQEAAIIKARTKLREAKGDTEAASSGGRPLAKAKAKADAGAPKAP